MDITGYNINISNATSYLIMTVNVTEYTYNVSEFGNYTVSVVATIEELKGEIDTKVIIVNEGMRMNNVIKNKLFTILVYNTPTYTTAVSPVLIESSIIITSSTTMCCSYTTKSPEVHTSIPVDTSDSIYWCTK